MNQYIHKMIQKLEAAKERHISRIMTGPNAGMNEIIPQMANLPKAITDWCPEKKEKIVMGYLERPPR